MYEILDKGGDRLVGVFDDIVPVGPVHYLGCGEETEEPIEELGRKTPIAHAPNETHRVLAELGKALLDAG